MSLAREFEDQEKIVHNCFPRAETLIMYDFFYI